MKMKLRGTDVLLRNDFISIHELIFYRENPRVYALTHAHPGFAELMESEQQEIIFNELKEQESYKKLLPDVRKNNGLMEPVLVRWDTMEVVEGNSRLAVYRHLSEKEPEGEWDLIPCNIASDLTDEQMVAFLSQVHVKGKTTWSAYEKANFAYVRKQAGWSSEKIADHFGESKGTIYKRIRVVERMKHNSDSNQKHFSYYEVIETKPELKQAIDGNSEFAEILLTSIRSFDSSGRPADFTAQEMRDKLPKIIEKPKVMKAFISGSVDLHEAYERARISKVEETVRKARGLLQDVGLRNIRELDLPRYNAFKVDMKNLKKEVVRISKMADENKPS
ncbi:MAG: hypothetical protein OXD00_11850 [Gammaproteobacteria bacterium]|nr:hypothetical protein [Gammaproteobacteria bacterium]